ncbi:MAG TPA: DUF4190 domain-containing protein [Pyrinomonadaceae bacterium]|nr:DUF4190 domain-containing protein [Pyrinomonadaceae bacterium]
MKKCLRCGQAYGDDSLNFCLNDGELLVDGRGFEPRPTQYADDSPPTLVLNQPRVTNPIDWPQTTPSQWQGHSPVPFQNYGMVGYGHTQNTTLATVSLSLGIASCFVVCCAGGIWLGLPAAVVGFLALRNVENNPGVYGGRGMAIGGMVIGIITFLASIVFLIFGQLS